LKAHIAYSDNTGAHIALLDPTTVFDDGIGDTLNGGAAMDWFFARLSGTAKDTLTNVLPGEIITSV
jgi:hypothetical protein